VTNVILHLLAGLILFGILRRICDLPTAFVCAVIWIVHPLNSEAVDYVAQRMESMAGLLWLFTLYAAIRAWSRKHSTRWQVLAVLACACGIATKELVVTAPLIVVLYDRVFVFESFRVAFKKRGRLYVALAGCWLVFAMLVPQAPFFRADSFYSPGNGFGARVSPWMYLLNQAPMILTYLLLSVLRRPLILDYGAPVAYSMLDVWPAALLVLTLLALTSIALVRLPRIGFWGAWFFITLAPASSLVPVPTEVGAERRMYLPLIAVIVLSVLAVKAMAGWFAGRTARARAVARVAGVVCTAIVVTGLTAATRQRNSEYRSAVSIWQTVIERRPNPRAHVNFAAVLADAGRIDEALAHLRTASADFVDARRILGLQLLLRGDNQEAIEQLSEFARRAPDDPDIEQVRRALAAAYVRVGAPAQAQVQLDIVERRAKRLP
jgi:tetratricopeptide (TPR) repeat protein